MKATGKNLRIVLIALLAAVMLAAAVLCSGTLFPSAAEGDAERDAAVAAFNGGLESEDGESLPAEWYFRERSTVKVDNAEYLEGKNSLYVVRDDYGSDFYTSSLNRIPVEGNTEYRFSYWIRSVGCDYASAIVKVVVYDEAGRQVTSRQSGETILNKDGENGFRLDGNIRHTPPAEQCGMGNDRDHGHERPRGILDRQGHRPPELSRI